MQPATWMDYAARLLEWVGVGVIVVGALFATARYLGDLRSGASKDSFDRFRANLGRAILLGLEFLVGADIIATVTAPLTLDSIGLLGLLVLIRTLLSFSLVTEIEGVAPWRRRETERGEAKSR